VWMLHGSCVSEWPACSRSAGGLAASAAEPVPGAAFEQVTSLAPEERSAPQCSARVAASEYCCYSYFRCVYNTLM